MHKSKLAGFIIDCQTTDLDRAADFWGGALGMPVRALPPGEGEIYKELEDSHHGMEAPTGQRFCVIRATSKDFDAKAAQWS